MSTGSALPTNVKLPYIPYTEEHAGACSIGIPRELDLTTVLPGHKVLIVAAPGAYTPTCTEQHIPGFVKRAAEIKSKGVDTIIVLTANDPFVQSGWSKDLGSKGELIFASDPKSAFSKQLGLAFPEDDFTHGRTKRYAIIVDDGIIKYLGVEDGTGALEKSTAEAVLKQLD